MAGKTTGTGRKKTTAKKTGSKTVKPRSTKSGTGTSTRKTTATKKKQAVDKTPFYVLAIMALLTIIIIMLINNYKAGERPQRTGTIGRKDTVVKKDDIDRKIDEALDRQKAAGNVTVKNNNKDKKDISRNTDADKKDAARGEYLIYLVKYNESSKRMSLLPVKRSLSSESPLKSTLNELIKGPSRNEQKRGLLTAIPDNLRLRNVQVVGKNAVLDFNGAIEENANGEILLTRIDQVVYTATQFDGVEAVIIKVNGRQKKFLGGDGLSINGPIGRR